MKYMNHIKLGLLAVTFACAGTVFTSCEDDITINAVNTEKLDTVDGVYGYVRSAAGARELTSGEFYQFNLSSCIRQQNSLTAQFVSFSLSNLANIFYPPQFLQ